MSQKYVNILIPLLDNLKFDYDASSDTVNADVYNIQLVLKAIYTNLPNNINDNLTSLDSDARGLAKIYLKGVSQLNYDYCCENRTNFMNDIAKLKANIKKSNLAKSK